MRNAERNSEAPESSSKELPDEFRCRRNDGKLWRCSLHVMEGRTLCEKHYNGLKHNMSRRSTGSRPKSTVGRPRIKPIMPSEEKPTTQKRKRANTSERPGDEQGSPKRSRKKKQQENQTNVIKSEAKNEEEDDDDEEEEETCRTSEKYRDSESGSESECETPPRKKFRIEGDKWSAVRDLDMRWKLSGRKLMRSKPHPKSVKKFLPNGLMVIPVDVNGRHDFKKIFKAVVDAAESMPKQVEFRLPKYDEGEFVKRK